MYVRFLRGVAALEKVGKQSVVLTPISPQSFVCHNFRIFDAEYLEERNSGGESPVP